MKKILITGGSGAIGGALVAEFAKDSNYEVWFSYHNNKKAADEIAHATNARAIQIKDNDIANVPNDFDVLVNNAASVIYDGLLETVADDHMRGTLETNLILPFMLTKHVLRHMKSKKWGRIINISSTNSISPLPEMTAYNVSKAALNALTKTIAKEYAEFGITCNAVLPGLVADVGMGMASCRHYDEDVDAIIAAHPAKRLLRANEVAHVCAFLASDGASFTNGVILPVDGGLTA